jgi:DNA-binding MarR family transcriptional regulator
LTFISLTIDACIFFTATEQCQLVGLQSLTTAAVTSIIDRLEEAGYVRRTNDPKDRRRTIVEPVRNKKLEKKLEMVFTPFHEKMYKLFSSYSDSELVFLVDVLTKSIELTREESKKLRMSLQGQSSSLSIGDRY